MLAALPVLGFDVLLVEVGTTSFQKETVSMAVEVWGIIVGYDMMRGIVLLQHRQFESLAEAVDAYVRKPGQRHWFAAFKWNAIEEADRHRLEQARLALPPITTQFTSKRKKKQLKKAEPNPMSSVLIGHSAQCVVEKRPKWEVLRLRLDFAQPRYSLPHRCLKQMLLTPPKDDQDAGPIPLNRVIPARSNIRRPWGGVSG